MGLPIEDASENQLKTAVLDNKSYSVESNLLKSEKDKFSIVMGRCFRVYATLDYSTPP